MVAYVAGSSSYFKNTLKIKRELLMNNSGLKLIISVLSFFSLVISIPCQALTPTQVFDKVKSSIVIVLTLDGQNNVKSQGSGVLLPSGKIATNYHVIEGGTFFRVGHSKQFFPAMLFAGDSDRDIGILYAEGITGKPVKLRKAVSLKVGEPVYAIGAPQGLELSLSNGIVAQLRGGPPPLIQTTAAISPGSSGGGLFDQEGRLVGLTTLYIEGGQSLNFAMPVEWIEEIQFNHKHIMKKDSQAEWIKRAAVLDLMQDWKGMIDWCKNWISKRSQDSDAWTTLGYAYQNLKEYKNAIAAFRESLRINPKNANVWINIGACYDKLQQPIETIESYHQALRINPEDDKIWLFLGYTYGKLNRLEDAIKAFTQALRINPEYVDAWVHIMIAYYAYGDKSSAFYSFERLRRLDPEKANEILKILDDIN
jgi:hypothetical protein